MRNLATMNPMNRRRSSGFTLMELMIVLVVVAILAAIAIPSYRQFVMRGNRAAAEGAMMDIANREQQFFLANRLYTESLSTTGLNYAIPDEVRPNYDSVIVTDTSLSPCTPAPCFTITFTAKDSQLGDGDLVLNSSGVKTRAGDPAKW